MVGTVLLMSFEFLVKSKSSIAPVMFFRNFLLRPVYKNSLEEYISHAYLGKYGTRLCHPKKTFTRLSLLRLHIFSQLFRTI